MPYIKRTSSSEEISILEFCQNKLFNDESILDSLLLNVKDVNFAKKEIYDCNKFAYCTPLYYAITNENISDKSIEKMLLKSRISIIKTSIINGQISKVTILDYLKKYRQHLCSFYHKYCVKM
jgi:hypothetical protein